MPSEEGVAAKCRATEWSPMSLVYAYAASRESAEGSWSRSTVERPDPPQAGRGAESLTE